MLCNFLQNIIDKKYLLNLKQNDFFVYVLYYYIIYLFMVDFCTNISHLSFGKEFI